MPALDQSPSPGAGSGGAEAGGATAAAAPARRRARWWWFWVRLAVAVGVLWYVVEKNGRGRIVHTLLTAHPGWVGLAVAVFLVSIALGAYQWYLLLKLQGIEFGYAGSFRAYYSGLFLNNFLPGTVGGDVLRVYEAQKGQGDGARRWPPPSWIASSDSSRSPCWRWPPCSSPTGPGPCEPR